MKKRSVVVFRKLLNISSAKATCDLAVQVQGKGFPILCLHGHPGSGQCMSVFTNHLSRRFRTLAPDLRGYGASPAPANFAIADHLEDLEGLLERFQIDQCLLLGWSLGGILAIELALRYPERVSGLILIASAARPRGNHPPVDWQDLLYTAVAATLNRVKPSWDWNIENFGKRSLFRYLLGQHTPVAYQYLASHAIAAYLQTSMAANRALQEALKTGYNRLADLHTIECPALVLAGAADCHITAASSLETANHLKNAEWQCYPDNAHLFPWEIPQQVLTDIDRWIEAYPSVIPTQLIEP